MTRSRQFGSSRLVRSPRRKTSWNAGPTQLAGTALSAAGSTIWSLGQSGTGDGLTIIRLRGEAELFLSVVTSVGDGFAAFAMGIGIVSSQAFAAGGASMPAPLTNTTWDGWMWHYSGAGLFGQSTTELAAGPIDAVRIPIDSKAMRKVGSNEVIFGAVEMGVETGTATAVFTANSRMLFKLP